MTVKSGLEIFILKFSEPLQSYCCPVQNNLPRKAQLAWQVSTYLWRGSLNFKLKVSKSHKQIILSSLTPKNQGNFLHFFAYLLKSHKKWSIQKIKAKNTNLMLFNTIKYFYFLDYTAFGGLGKKCENFC